jgi:hypothetical protein
MAAKAKQAGITLKTLETWLTNITLEEFGTSPSLRSLGEIVKNATA